MDILKNIDIHDNGEDGLMESGEYKLPKLKGTVLDFYKKGFLNLQDDEREELISLFFKKINQ